MKHITAHIHKEVKSHLFDYILLLTGGVFFLLALQIFRGERLLEFIVLLAFCSFYIIWGFYHHVIEDSIRLKTVLEYVLIGFTIIFLLKLLVYP